MSYHAFLDTKKRMHRGDALPMTQLPAALYDWQQAIVRWALRKGRAAIFADCGLGKTFMQLAWAAKVPGPVLLVAPLCVAEQTAEEAHKLRLTVRYVRAQDEVDGHHLTITNYERLENFDPSHFAGVVLDESSILKAFDGKTRKKLIRMFKDTRYRLCCTATPSPNDIAELGNHAEFLGLMTHAEFLATWFVHDDDGWRMKRHATDPFYRWLASWAVALRSPADLGYDPTGFDLPPLTIKDCVVESGHVSDALFPELGMHGIQGRIAARRGSLDARIEATARLTGDGDTWLLWCGLNEEADALVEVIPDAVQVKGTDSYSEKVGAVQAFLRGDTRVLVTKPKILGFGMNFQHCSRMAFVGLSDSYEGYYQCIRRCWRYGQQRPVDAWIVVSDRERLIVENVRRKEQIANTLADRLLAAMRAFEREEVVAA